jgi:hypothetical protein
MADEKKDELGDLKTEGKDKKEDKKEKKKEEKTVVKEKESKVKAQDLKRGMKIGNASIIDDAIIDGGIVRFVLLDEKGMKHPTTAPFDHEVKVG